jgi:hypothetical protein
MQNFHRPVSLVGNARFARLHREDVGHWVFKHIETGVGFEFDGQYGEAMAALEMDFFEQGLPEGVYELDLRDDRVKDPTNLYDI